MLLSSRSRSLRSSLPTISALVLIALAFAGVFFATPQNAVVADHESTYVVCPDAILEGNTANMRVRKSGHDSNHVFAFTYTEGYTADEDDFEEYHGKKFTGASGGDSVFIPVEIEEDDRLELNETFALGFWDDKTWHGCEIRIIDDDVPEIVNIQITSWPPTSYYYFAEEAVDVKVTFDQPVETTEDTLLSLFVGNEGESTWRGARYHHGSGTQHLTFRYRVQPSDMDLNGISVSSAGMDIERNSTYGFSGQINAAGTDIPVNYNHDGIGNASRHMIDGRPIALKTGIVSSPEQPWKAYRANQTIEVAFTYNIDVEVEGNPTVALGIGWDGKKLG